MPSLALRASEGLGAERCRSCTAPCGRCAARRARGAASNLAAQDPIDRLAGWAQGAELDARPRILLRRRIRGRELLSLGEVEVPLAPRGRAEHDFNSR